MKKLLCFLFGHRPGKGLFEDEDIITDKGCSRCGQTFMTARTRWKGKRQCPPPFCSLKYWERFCDAQDEEARKEFSAQ